MYLPISNELHVDHEGDDNITDTFYVLPINIKVQISNKYT